MRSLLAVCACLGLVALAVAEPPGRLAKGPPGRMPELLTYAPPVDSQEIDEPPIDGRLVVLTTAGTLTMPGAPEDARPADVELCCHKKNRSRNPDPAPDDGNGNRGGAYGGNFQRYIPTCEPPEQTAQAAAGTCPCTCGNCCCKQNSARSTVQQAPVPRPVYSYPVNAAPSFYGGGDCANGQCSNGQCSTSYSSRSRGRSRSR
jgi:hypothetical protein